MSVSYMDVGQSDPFDERYWICESDDDDIDYDELNWQEEMKCMEREAKRPKRCDEECPWGHTCYHEKKMNRFYEDCAEYWHKEGMTT